MNGLKTLSLLFFLVLPCSTNRHANAGSDIRAAGVTQKEIKTHDLSFAVSIEDVLQKIRQKINILIVDVRSPQEYNKVHIPGSVNIALYAVKTKTFLKTSHVVLVNSGYAYGQLEGECINLKKNGFNVSILWGGLNAWKESGMKFEGDVFAVKEFGKVSPRDVCQEKGFNERVVMNVSPKLTSMSGQLFPGAIHAGALTEKILKKFSAGKAQKKFSSTLIFNEDGKGYEKYEESVKKTGLKNVFYLTGGLNDYARYVNILSHKAKTGENQVKTVKKCVPCGE